MLVQVESVHRVWGYNTRLDAEIRVRVQEYGVFITCKALSPVALRTFTQANWIDSAHTWRDRLILSCNNGDCLPVHPSPINRAFEHSSGRAPPANTYSTLLYSELLTPLPTERVRCAQWHCVGVELSWVASAVRQTVAYCTYTYCTSQFSVIRAEETPRLKWVRIKGAAERIVKKWAREVPPEVSRMNECWGWGGGRRAKYRTKCCLQLRRVQLVRTHKLSEQNSKQI